MTGSESSWGYRLACYGFGGLVGVTLLLCAFYAGMMLTVADDDSETYESPVAPVVSTEGNGAPKTDEAVPTTMVGDIQVDWLPVSEPVTKAFNFYLRQAWASSYEISDVETNYRYAATILGTIRGGDFDGKDLVAETISSDMEMGGSAQTFYLIEPQKSDRGATLLSEYVYYEPTFNPFVSRPSEADNFLEGIRSNSAAFSLAVSDATVTGMNPTEVAIGKTGAFRLVGIGARLNEEMQKQIASYPLRDVSVDGMPLREFASDTLGGIVGIRGTLFRPIADDRLAFYDIDVPFWNNATDPFIPTPQSPEISWDDGGANFPDGYLKSFIGGCGTVSPTNVIYDLDESLIAKTGTVAQTGEPVYEYKNYLDTDDYRNWQFAHQDNPPSYESFAASHPSFFYKDALGRWIKFTGASVIPPGECGKPVIYLYPETTTDLTVTLAPRGGFTKSEPAYGNGWNVTARPDGSLVNKADGKPYPYLFWEGRGGYYSAPTKYWVVAKNDVHAFLVSTLAKIGLNKKETADFLEFWEPRMQAAPFYKIGFHGTTAMNQIAPLTISQPPDTLLRVLMDYEPLSIAIPANPPTLPATPIRKGFTAIEWGGVIR